MIKYRPQDNIFDYAGEPNIIINPVNCRGKMGAGLAKEFATRYPMLNFFYMHACSRNEIEVGKADIGRILIEEDKEYTLWYANFPTKRHWRDRSKYDEVAKTAEDLVQQSNRNMSCYSTIVMPKVGCGLGGLEWNKVHQLLVPIFEQYKGDTIFIAPRPVSANRTYGE